MANYVNLLDIVYPVNSMYFSFSSISPSSIVGGTWTQLSNRVIRASDNILTGGADSSNYDFDHNHYMSMNWSGSYNFETVSNRSGINIHNGDCISAASPIMTSLSSSMSTSIKNPGENSNTQADGKPLSKVTINNLPAYQNCYIWYRTA